MSIIKKSVARLDDIVSRIPKALRQVRYLATQTNTWLVATASALTLFAQVMAPLAADGEARIAVQAALTLAGVLGAAAAVVRRSTPVGGDSRRVPVSSEDSWNPPDNWDDPAWDDV